MNLRQMLSIGVGVAAALFTWRTVVRPMKLSIVGLKSNL